jgi:hypothetical protein
LRRRLPERIVPARRAPPVATQDIILSVLPSDDEGFHDFVHLAWTELHEEVAPPSEEQLLRRLRTRFPHVVVRPRDDIGALGGEVTWYVFRELPLAPSVHDQHVEHAEHA